VTCAHCGKDLAFAERRRYGRRCSWCATPARGLLLAFAVSCLTWYAIWHLSAPLLARLFR
jgi:hypothetical protein